MCVCNGSIVLALGAPKEAAISEATVLAPSFARAHQALTASLRKTQPLAQTRPAANKMQHVVGRATWAAPTRNKCIETNAAKPQREVFVRVATCTVARVCLKTRRYVCTGGTPTTPWALLQSTRQPANVYAQGNGFGHVSFAHCGQMDLHVGKQFVIDSVDDLSWG